MSIIIRLLISKRVRILSLFGFSITLFGLISCEKYLDKKSNNTLVVPTTVTDLQGLLDDGNLMNANLTPCFGEASADDYFLQQSLYDGRGFFERQAYIWIPADYDWQNDWSKGYSPVYTTNYCLEMIEKVVLTSLNETAWKNVKGSALFYRAYNFLNLLWNHGKAYDRSSSNVDLGIALRVQSDFNIPSSRANVEQCYSKIITDVKEASFYLPDISSHTMRPSKAASYALLARTYLSMREYDSAFKYSAMCLSLKSDLLNYNTEISASASVPFTRFNKETIFYSEMNNIIGLIAPNRAKIDTFLYSSYANNDQRRIAFFAANGTSPGGLSLQRFKGTYSANSFLFSGLATNEMYLIRAECYARAGEKVSALADLNFLLRKRHTGTFVDITASDAMDALNKILLERRKELVMRGLRWMDIKRLNKEGKNIVLSRLINGQSYTLQPNANYYALPLPTDIINLTNMPQNPY